MLIYFLFLEIQNCKQISLKFRFFFHMTPKIGPLCTVIYLWKSTYRTKSPILKHPQAMCGKVPRRGRPYGKRCSHYIWPAQVGILEIA